MYIHIKLALAATLFSLFADLNISAEESDLVELPLNLEITLALSALPEALQQDATVYVRDPKKGFVLYREGSNGFAAFVGRTSTRFYEADWAYTYPSDQLIPIAFDQVGIERHMIPWFDLERMRIDGVPPERAKETLRKRFNNGTYSAPTIGGISYMFAPIHRAYGAPALSAEMITVSFPHLMPYAPYAVAEHLGPMDPHGRAGLLDHGGHDAGPHGYLYIMVPGDQADHIRSKYVDTLHQLCELHANWCLITEQASQ